MKTFNIIITTGGIITVEAENASEALNRVETETPWHKALEASERTEDTTWEATMNGKFNKPEALTTRGKAARELDAHGLIVTSVTIK